MTRHVTVELPEEAMQVLRPRPDQPPQELRETAVLRWFEKGRLFAGALPTAEPQKRRFSGADDP